METEEQKALREKNEQKHLDAVKAAVKEQVDPLKAEVKSATEKNVELQTKLAAAEAKLDTIEKSPIFKAPALVCSKEYLGYKIDKMLAGGANGGDNLRDTFMKGGFGALKSEEAQDDFIKNMLDIVKGIDKRNGSQFILGNAEAKNAMEARRQAVIKAGLEVKTNANNEGANAEGGYLVQPEYQWDIIKLARNKSYALQLARVVNMISNVQYVPTELTHGAVTWETEGATKTPSEPTFNQIKLTAYKAFCLARITNEELADTSVDIVGMITEQFAYATAQDIDNQWLNGNGVPWSGLLSTITTSVILATTGSISGIVFTDLSNQIAQIVEARLQGASFLMGRNAKHYVRSMKDTYGRPVFAMPGGGVPGTIYEYPYYLSEKMPNGLGASVKSILLGNFQYSVLGRRQGVMNIDVDPYGMFDSDTTRFRMVTRWAHALGMQDAFCLLKTS